MVAIVAVGDNVVDCYEAPPQMFPGGNSLNVSVFARRAGARASYIGAVGQDQAGKLISRSLLDEGVDIRRLRSEPGQTAYCLIGHHDGDRIFLGSALGVSRFELGDDDLDFIGTHDAAHVSQSSGLDHRLADIADRTRLSYDFSTRADDGRLALIARHCFLASFSGGEVSDAEAAETSASALAAGAEWALVTRGARGATLANADGSHAVAAVSNRVVDTLGAGDTFIARVLVGLASGEPPEQALADAAIRAGDTCTRHGAFGHGADLSVASATT
ncbi:PfkB family carbohydrate kinase [Glaciibacter sp. 2TAF33]|uniref:PfkB family carbohydrate kinase n=1 Tax=Glaciibacter sp. 2TAF33 TaxID=3233015 RepID=UPI003F8FB51D